MKKFVVYLSITLGFLSSSLPIHSMDLPEPEKPGQSVTTLRSWSDEEEFRQSLISILDNSALSDQQKSDQIAGLLNEEDGQPNAWDLTDEQKITRLQKYHIIKALETDYAFLKKRPIVHNFYIIEELANPYVSFKFLIDKDFSQYLVFQQKINLSNRQLYKIHRWDSERSLLQEPEVICVFLAPLATLHDLRSFDLSSNGIKAYDKGFVEAFVNSISKLTTLTSLNLKENGIGDFLHCLSNLPWLKSLNLESTGLTGNPIYIASLTRLEELNLGKSHIGDMSFLRKLISLISLNLKWKWGISDLTHLSLLTDLTNLNLEGTLIKNMSSLGPLTGLTSLNLAHSKIEEGMNVVSSLTGLTSLNMEFIRIGGTGSLRKLPLLKDPQWGFIKLKMLGELTNLKDLNLGDNNIKRIGNLRHLTGLKNLNLSDNEVTHLEPLSNLTNLHSVNLKDNYISNLEDLYHLINLRYLNLEKNPINNFKVLPRLTGLESLNLAKTGFEDGMALSSLTHLKCLIVRENKCGKEMTPLSSLTNLTKLDMENTGSTSLSFLHPLTALTCLSFGDKGIGEYEGSVFKSLTGLRFLNVGLNGLTLKDWSFIDVSSLKEIHIQDNDRIAIYLQGVVGKRLKVENRTSSGVEKFQDLNLEYDWER